MSREGSGGTPQKPLHERLLMVLWYQASQDKYAAIADNFGMDKSTANLSIRNLLSFICTYLCDKLIHWPTRDEQEEMQALYMDLYNFPGIVGMIDGTHVQIRKPDERGYDYYNRKDYYSVVLQVVCRENLLFTDVYAGWPGKVHDARVFRHSPLFERGRYLCTNNGHILADSACPTLEWVLLPFHDNGHLTAAQSTFNREHSKLRSAVERAIGQYKGRFPRLQNLDQRNMETIVSTIIAACVMHNICIMQNDQVPDVLYEEPVAQPLPNAENFDQNALLQGAQKRLTIARRLVNQCNWTQ